MGGLLLLMVLLGIVATIFGFGVAWGTFVALVAIGLLAWLYENRGTVILVAIVAAVVLLAKGC